jgi:hypothetical protein
VLGWRSALVTLASAWEAVARDHALGTGRGPHDDGGRRSRGNSCAAGSQSARRPVARAGLRSPSGRRRRARVAGISRQAIYRRPKRAPAGQRRPPDATDRVVLDVARENPTDGTRMVAALASRWLASAAVNRKRVQRLMREHRLFEPKRSERRRRRPGYFQVTPGRALAPGHDLGLGRRARLVLPQRGDRPLPCEITGWALDIRSRAQQAVAVIDRAVIERGIGPGELTRFRLLAYGGDSNAYRGSPRTTSVKKGKLRVDARGRPRRSCSPHPWKVSSLRRHTQMRLGNNQSIPLHATWRDRSVVHGARHAGPALPGSPAAAWRPPCEGVMMERVDVTPNVPTGIETALPRRQEATANPPRTGSANEARRGCAQRFFLPVLRRNRSVTVVRGAVFARLRFTNRPVTADRTRVNSSTSAPWAGATHSAEASTRDRCSEPG